MLTEPIARYSFTRIMDNFYHCSRKHPAFNYLSQWDENFETIDMLTSNYQVLIREAIIDNRN